VAGGAVQAANISVAKRLRGNGFLSESVGDLGQGAGVQLQSVVPIHDVDLVAGQVWRVRPVPRRPYRHPL
jgi:hypothetical protein